MATCNDCLHFEACASMLRYIGFPVSEKQTAEDVEELCDDFKDKSRFIELPCKVWDKVYWINRLGEVAEAIVIKNGFSARIKSGFEYDIGYDEIGKTVFLTKEGAEVSTSERTKNEI